MMREYFDRIYSKPRETFYEELKYWLKNNEKKFIVTANPETLMIAEENSEFKNIILNKNAVIVPDGIGIIKGAKILKYDINETITGIDICNKLFEYLNSMNKTLFLLGAKKEVVEKLRQVLNDNYPNIQILGSVDGYVENKDEVFEEIKEKKPDVCLVALGIPRQELLISKHIKDFDKGIFIGVGGSFDVLSGSKKRAPKIFIKLKIEWLYRIVREPKRLKRFFKSNIRYIGKIRKEKI